MDSLLCSCKNLFPKCLNLCSFSVVIVTGGNNAEKSVELLYTNGTRRCSLPDLPQARHYPTQVGLVTCASSEAEARKSCVTLSGGGWKKSHTLTGSAGYTQVGWASPKGVLLMGGTSGKGTVTELLMKNGHTKPVFRLNYHSQ